MGQCHWDGKVALKQKKGEVGEEWDRQGVEVGTHMACLKGVKRQPLGVNRKVLKGKLGASLEKSTMKVKNTKPRVLVPS